MPEPGLALRNDRPRWEPDHRLTPGFVDFAGDALIARERALYPSRRIRRPVIDLCHVYHRNYGHWMIDLLPFLLAWSVQLQHGQLSVLVPPMTAAWQRRTFELLGVPVSAVIEAPELSVLCDDIIIPGLTRAPGATPLQPASDVIETIKILRREAYPATAVDQPERIYVSRRGVESFRSMTNEEDVEVAMSRLGFAVIQPQELAFDEQVRYFARARVIVGPHGAGLNNSMFAPPGCLVVDVLPDVWTPIWVLSLTQLFEHHYLPAAYAADPALSQPVLLGNVVIANSTAYSVPANAFATIVADAMQRMGI